MYLDTQTFRCIEEGSCARTDTFGYQMILYKSKNVCLREDQRYDYDCYLYGMDGKLECVTIAECKADIKWNAYY